MNNTFTFLDFYSLLANIYTYIYFSIRIIISIN